MKEYIERAAALDICQKEYEERLRMADYCGDTVAWNIGGAIKSLPAADVAEVRHGRWVGIEYDGYADGCPVYDLWECSECGEEVRGEDVPDTHPWCHACGARMDKEDENEAD